MVGMPMVVGLLMHIQCRLKMVELRLHSHAEVLEIPLDPLRPLDPTWAMLLHLTRGLNRDTTKFGKTFCDSSMP